MGKVACLAHVTQPVTYSQALAELALCQEQAEEDRKQVPASCDLAVLSKTDMLVCAKGPRKGKNEQSYNLRGAEEEYLLK